jgi:adenylate kinase family enzyme
MKVWIVGNPAAGKSTVARVLASRLDVPHVQLDAAFWTSDWTPVAETDFLAQVRKLVDQPGWVVDGQYNVAIQAFVTEADAVVWLDVPLWRSLPRLIRRTFGRVRQGTPLWGGNRETYWHAIGPGSIIWYAISIYRRSRRRNADLFAQLSNGSTMLLRERRSDPTRVLSAIRSNCPSPPLGSL